MKGLRVLAVLAAPAIAQVPYDRIVKSDSEPANWLTYAGSYKSQRYTALDQINKQNVTQLRPLWVYQIRQAGIIETSPIVADGVMYITEPPSTVTALDAKSGAVRWDVAVDDNHLGYYLTLAPLAIDGKVVVGVSGAEAGIRGF